jgi:[protein-PII] uridylyltransferase
MLFVLTAADTKAVAPGEWTVWKQSLLSELYSRAMSELTGPMASAEEPKRMEALAARHRSELRGAFPEEWLGAQLAAMPPEYLEQTSSIRLACDLQALRRLSPGGVEVVSEYLREMQLMRYTVFAHDGIVPGLFSRIAGVLAANGFQIIDAQIVTRSDGVIMDTFVGTDTDFAGEPPLWRREEISSQLCDVLRGRQDVEALLSRRGGSRARTGHRLTLEPSRVAIDNESSDRFTIVDVFAPDRLGLLHAITKALFEDGLSVHSAKVSTHYDQVVDVFYVTDAAGKKVCEERRLESIRQRILASL